MISFFLLVATLIRVLGGTFPQSLILTVSWRICDALLVPYHLERKETVVSSACRRSPQKHRVLPLNGLVEFTSRSCCADCGQLKISELNSMKTLLRILSVR